MQEQLELKRAQNREKQRVWREKNLEKSKFMKFNSTRKFRGNEPISFEEYRARPVFIPKGQTNPSQALGTRTDDTTPIDVSLCMNCYRKYLTKLYCLWCNDKDYGRNC